MSVIDILTRVDAICKKYDKYNVDKQRADVNLSGDDAFARLYASVDEDIAAALEKAEMVSNEKNRAAAVAINAEIRRTKVRLLEELPKLQRLALKKDRVSGKTIGRARERGGLYYLKMTKSGSNNVI